ncbi:uncharacterized protein LOC142176207 [Nicotiana tabacum]|uniref:Uncharacterized protein LOC142176207 n=1 Tax=Nicotiana tabacum TaxID=4097 RepID=A0AC58TQC3_TOBAC
MPLQGDGSQSKMNPDRGLGEDVLTKPASPAISSFGKVVSPPLPSSFFVEGRAYISSEDCTTEVEGGESYAKLSKSEFWLSSVALLEHVVSSEGIKVDLKNIEVVQGWPRPSSTIEIQSFLGSAGYYHYFVEGFSSIASPLERLTQKGTPFKLSDAEAKPPTLHLVPVFSEFPDVFSDELLGISRESVREIEFSIDVPPYTIPLSIPLYRMAPAELKELKAQLKDYLDKGFIRPNDILVYSVIISRTRRAFAKGSIHTPGSQVIRQVFQVRVLVELSSFYGHIVSDEGIKVDHRKVEAVKNWPSPTNPIEVCSFLGLGGYYRMLVENFSSIATPLTMLMHKVEKFGWTDVSKKSFQELRESVQMKHGKIFAYASRPLRKQKKNYPTHDLELAAVIFSLMLWHHYLYGVHVNIYTNHKILKYIFKQIEFNLRQQRWLELLKDYDVGILYHPKKANIVADALSQKSMCNLEDYKLEMANSCTAEEYAKLYIKEIVRLHGVLVSIVSDRVALFIAKILEISPKRTGYQNQPQYCFSSTNRRKGENDSKSVIDRSKQAKVLLRYPKMRFGVCLGDWVFLRVSLKKGVMRFVKKGKLSPRYIRPYQIIQKVSQVSFKLELPPKLEGLHLVFHVSMLRKFLSDPPDITPINDIQVIEDLSYEEVPMAILDRQARKV